MDLDILTAKGRSSHGQYVPVSSQTELPRRSARSERSKNWKKSLVLFAVASGSVFVCNTSFMIWAIASRRVRDGRGTMFEASCSRVRNTNLFIHLLINILSTLLLGASNYSMQCLSAPSRPELGKAHSEGKYLEIGIPSPHNIFSRYLPKRRKICWWILALSSLPLHLCYNSVVFSSRTASMYGVFQFSPSTAAAIEQGTYDYTADPHNYVFPTVLGKTLYRNALREDNLMRLEPLECINAYSQPYQSNWGNVFLFLSDDAEDYDDKKSYYFPFIEGDGTCAGMTGTDWIYKQYDGLYGQCTIYTSADSLLPKLRNNSTNWAPFGKPVGHCMSEPAEEHCRLQFSIDLLAVVIAFNALKCLAVIAALFCLREKPILTVGDAISAFLKEPDVATDNTIALGRKSETTGEKADIRWFRSVRFGKLVAVIAALFISIVVLMGLLIWGYNVIEGNKTFGSVIKARLGELDPRMIIRDATRNEGKLAIIQNVLLANAPQIIISLVYFSYNAVVSSMLMAYEFTSYLTTRKSLRVTSSRAGAQRSSYFLQIPYRYGVLLLCMSALLHWLASQSIFLVAVEVQNMRGEHNEDGCVQFFADDLGGPKGYKKQYNCGHDFIASAYSPQGILLTLCVAIFLTIVLVGFGYRRMEAVPEIGSSSVGIGAAAHARLGEENPWEKEVKWGVYPETVEWLEGLEVGRCGISGLDVERPGVGWEYR